MEFVPHFRESTNPLRGGGAKPFGPGGLRSLASLPKIQMARGAERPSKKKSSQVPVLSVLLLLLLPLEPRFNVRGSGSSSSISRH